VDYTESIFRLQSEFSDLPHSPKTTKMTPPTKTKSPPAGAERAQRADARRNREAILEAARECFAREGLECGIDEIAREAGVGVGTVYRHFPNKDDLVAALVHDRFARLAERAEEALGEDDPWEAFCELMRWSARLQAQDRALSEYLSSTPALGQHEAVQTGLAERTEKLIKKAQRAGSMRKDIVIGDVPTMICGLAAATSGHPESMTVLNWERFLEIILDGMRAAPGTRKLPRPRASLR